MDIRICIAELLSLYDCVIIPGFGGFIGNYSPARIDPVNHLFQPPYKHLLFNINLKQNDGLLANAVAKSLDISYSESCSLIDKFADDCRFSLKSGTPFILPQVGKLFSGKEGIICFEQEQGANLLPDSFGLTSFISPPVHRPSARKIVLPRPLRWAAVIALPVGLATVIGLTQYDKLSANFANTAGILGSVVSRFSAASLIEKKEAPVPSKIKVLKPKTVVAEAIPAEVVTPAIQPDDRFAVIVGAFRMKENAEKLVSELRLKGKEASIFDQSKTGLFRVTIGTSSDRVKATELLASAMSTDFSGAWILAK